jgi:sugar porter (SP) family MFS transporter
VTGWLAGWLQAVPLYLSEMAPTRWRGGLNILFQLAVTIGILFANLVNYGTGKMKHDGWRVSLGLAGIPAGLLTLGGILLPETPNSLVQRGKLEQGRKVLRKIRGIENVDAEFEDLILAAEESKRIINPFRNLMLRRNRPQLVIAFIMQFFQQFTGINAIMFYAPVLFQTLGFQSDASLYSAVITGAVNVVSTVVAIVVVDRAGRRILLLEAGVQMFISQTAIAIILAVGMKNGVSLSHTLGVIVVVLICVYVSSFAWSWGPLGWLIPSEIFPLEARSAGQSVTVSSNLFFTFVIAQAFLSMLCAFKWGIFLFFAGWVIIMQIFVILFLPETKGIPIEEMEVVWTKHWFWKRFVPDAPIVDHAGIPTIDDTKKSNNLKPATTNGADNGYHNNHNAGQQA